MRSALVALAAMVLVAGAAYAVHAANRASSASVVRPPEHPVPLAAAQQPSANSRIVESAVTSGVLGRDVAVKLYVPAHVRNDKKYPWLLLLHGNPGSDDDFFAHGFAHTLDVAIAHHELPPVYAIAPDGNAGPDGDSEWLDSPFASMETFVIDDMIPVLQRELPLSARSDDHAIIGVSMGGYGALNLTYRHTDTFRTVVSFSGYAVADGSVFTADSPQGRANSPQLLAAENGRRVATMLVDGGALDLPGFAAENQALATTLRDVHADVEVHEEQAAHSWSYWTRLFPAALEFVGDRLHHAHGSP